jgi:transposase-like protein
MDKSLTCPECRSTQLIKFGTKFHKGTNNKRVKVPQYMCNRCGRITIKPLKLPPRDNTGRFTKEV